MVLPRILIADEDATHRKLVTLLAQKAGYGADSVSRCEDAIEAARSGRYSLVLVDLGVPRRTDGLRCIRDLRAIAQQQGRFVPVIALTAHAMPDDRQLCLSGGADDYLSKPFTSHQLNDLLGHWIKESQGPYRKVS